MRPGRWHSFSHLTVRSPWWFPAWSMATPFVLTICTKSYWILLWKKALPCRRWNGGWCESHWVRRKTRELVKRQFRQCVTQGWTWFDAINNHTTCWSLNYGFNPYFKTLTYIQNVHPVLKAPWQPHLKRSFKSSTLVYCPLDMWLCAAQQPVNQ